MVLSLDDAKRVLQNPVDKFDLDKQALRMLVNELFLRVEDLELKLAEKKGRKK